MAVGPSIADSLIQEDVNQVPAVPSSEDYGSDPKVAQSFLQHCSVESQVAQHSVIIWDLPCRFGTL